MVNKTLIFLAGAAVGSVITYFLTKRVFQKKADDEIAEMYQKYRIEKYGESTAAADEAVKENEKRKEEILNKVRSERNMAEKEEEEPWLPDEERITYGDIASKYKYGNGDHTYRLPYVITEKEWNDPKYKDHSKGLVWNYYIKNGVVTNEMDEELTVHEVQDYLGDEFMEYFRDKPDKEECYVRNDRMRLDILVQKINDFYVDSEEGERNRDEWNSKHEDESENEE